MTRICVLGIGSPNGDDQAGWLTIDALLAADLPAHCELVIEKLDRPGAHLISLLGNADWAILVDAMQSGSQPGRIQRFERDAWPGYAHGLSSHGLGVLDALSLGRELGRLPQRIDLYGIEIGSASPCDQADAAIHAAAQQLARRLVAELARLPCGAAGAPH